MTQTIENDWFRTRRQFDPDDYAWEDVWSPILYAIDVSCGRWSVSLTIRKRFETLAQTLKTGAVGWPGIALTSQLLDQAYQRAYQDLERALPATTVREEEIRSAFEMIWELPDDWQPDLINTNSSSSETSASISTTSPELSSEVSPELLPAISEAASSDLLASSEMTLPIEEHQPQSPASVADTDAPPTDNEQPGLSAENLSANIAIDDDSKSVINNN